MGEGCGGNGNGENSREKRPARNHVETYTTFKGFRGGQRGLALGAGSSRDKCRAGGGRFILLTAGRINCDANAGS